MNSQEKALIAGLFDRLRAAGSAYRDPEAERYIDDQVAAQPHAPYAMAQTVIVQNQTLEAANARIEDLERQLAAARGGAAEDRPAPSPWGPRASEAMERDLPGRDDDDDRSSDGYHGGSGDRAPAGRFGGAPSGSGLDYGPPPTFGRRPSDGAPQQPYGSPGQPYAAQQATPGRGGGFLTGALATAAGVAGGALLYQGLSSMFGGDEANAGAAAPLADAGSQAAAASSSAGDGSDGGWFDGLLDGVDGANDGGGDGDGDGGGDWL